MEMSDFKLKRISLKSLIREKKIYPITFDFKKLSRYYIFERKIKKIEKVCNNFKTPPGIKIYQVTI